MPHGFRSSFWEWAAERTNHPRGVVEAGPAHVVQNKVEAAYARSDLSSAAVFALRPAAPAKTMLSHLVTAESAR